MGRVDIKTGFTCNNNCRFCVQAGNKYKGNRSFEEIENDLKGARDKCDGVVFTGGEVTIRKDFFDLVKLAKDLGYKVIQIQSNGRMFASLDFCKKALEAGATEFSPALHGYCKEQHDFLTGVEGSFNQTVKGIKNLKSLGAFVLTNTVVVKPNYCDIPKIATLLVRLGVDQFQFAFVHALGNARENYDNIVPCVSLAAPFIHQGLQIGIDAGKNVMAEAMPYCVMRGYEKYVAERVIPETMIRGSKVQNTDDYTSQRRNYGKMKFPKCRSCLYYGVCEGPWKEYPEQKGDEEFIPVRPEFMQGMLLREFEEVLDDKKKVQRGVIRTKDVVILKKIYEQNNLKLEFSDFEVEYDKGLRTRYGKGNLIFYASKDSTATKLKELEAKEKDDIEITREIGLMLGYPKCCIEFFIKHKDKETPAIIMEAIKNTSDAKAELNIIEFPMISHIPCSLDCSESLKRVNVIDTERDMMAAKYEYFLSGAFVNLDTGRRSKGDFNGSFDTDKVMVEFR